MKNRLKKILLDAAEAAHKEGKLPSSDFGNIELDEPKADSHGDFSTNMAMQMAKSQKMPPRKIAEAILKYMANGDDIMEKSQIAGPGFINFFLNSSAWLPALHSIHEKGEQYGACNIGNNEKIQIEFVSSNPTGPLHVGHGRGAAVGDSVAGILSFCGYDVQREYYINDSGRQINTLGRSVFLRGMALLGKAMDFPDECYQGDYIKDLAREVIDLKGKAFFSGNEADAVSFCATYAAKKIITGIKGDLEAFGVTFDNWFSEQSLYDNGRVEKEIKWCRDNGLIYEKDGALWFKTSDFGDEKDRVVVRNNGITTYFASDIAYHNEKYERGFERVIDVWGADHHGYIPRMTAAIEACGKKRDQFGVILVQLVNLLRGGEPVAMSTRAGEFVTLNDVVDEVGSDAARFIFLTRHYESPLDFDLELARKKTNDNPVYYVQYVHARISSIIRKAEGLSISRDEWTNADAGRIQAPEEIQLIKSLARYPEVVEAAGRFMEPHRVTYYLMSLSSLFHAYYNRHKVLTDDPELAKARLYLVDAVRQVIKNGLCLLGVSAPEKM